MFSLKSKSFTLACIISFFYDSIIVHNFSYTYMILIIIISLILGYFFKFSKLDRIFPKISVRPDVINIILPIVRIFLNKKK